MDETKPENARPEEPSEAEAEQTKQDKELDAALDVFDKAIDLIAPRLKAINQSQESTTLAPENLATMARLLNIPTDDTVYHYTTAGGLKGIVEHGCFHASSAYFMNDSSEIDYGCQLFGEVLSEWCKEHPSDGSIGAWVLDHLRKRFVELSDLQHILAQVYVVCFCEEPNLLSQWRTYGQDGGYSVGFHRSQLQEFRSDAKNVTISLQRVIYNSAQQRKTLEPLLCDGMPELRESGVQNEFDALTPRSIAIFLRMFAFTMEISVLRQIVRFKHPAFSDEREWRLIAAPRWHSLAKRFEDSAFINFKPAHGVLTPYMELKPDGKLMPISSVRFGPTLDRKRVEHSLTMLFKKFGYPDIPIEGSDIPVRL